MSEFFKDQPEFIELDLGESLISRTETLGQSLVSFISAGVVSLEASGDQHGRVLGAGAMGLCVSWWGGAQPILGHPTARWRNRDRPFTSRQ